MRIVFAQTFLLLLAFSGQMYAERHFPPPRVGTAGIVGEWSQSPIVAIGEIDRIWSYGHHTIAALPPPASPEVHNLNWCVGDFHCCSPGGRYGTNRYVGIVTKKHDATPMSPREKFDRLLLTPSESGGDTEAYADYLWEVEDIACELLGQSACAELIRGRAPRKRLPARVRLQVPEV